MDLDHYIILSSLFFIIALVYSSVGFGGGSSYLAVAALFGITGASLPVIALFCNITVVAIGTVYAVKNDYLRLRRFAPFIASSVPFAFLGGILSIPGAVYSLIAGLTLCGAGALLFFKQSKPITEFNSASNHNFLRHPVVSLAAGGLIGFLSGVVGIGGGIFLAPYLYFLKWGNYREIQSATAFFILVNSIAGLTGQILRQDSFFSAIGALKVAILLGISVFLGGLAGSKLGFTIFKERTIRAITGAIVILAGTRFLFTYFNAAGLL